MQQCFDDLVQNRLLLWGSHLAFVLHWLSWPSSLEVQIQDPFSWLCLFTAEFCACVHSPLLTVQWLFFCASCVSEECLVMWSSHAHKQKFPAYPRKKTWREHRISCFRNTDSLLTLSKAVKLGRVVKALGLISGMTLHYDCFSSSMV